MKTMLLTNPSRRAKMITTVKSCCIIASQPRQMLDFLCLYLRVWSAADKAKAKEAHRCNARLLAPDAFLFQESQHKPFKRGALP